uniref:IstB domain protein ATP-binding protein n=1 Tax=Cereibacter sphaeroides (strain ATCC 17025 / ATH 2.4.3) TaxID=349102 RepID=A4WQP2_CERS5
MSERVACRVLGQHRSTQRKVPRGRPDEEALTADIVALASRYGRYGYRRITALLREAGWAVNVKRVERIWRREGLKIPQKQIVSHKLLIIDELGFVPLSKTGAELLFELISQRYERGATLITSNLPFDEWTETFGTERLTGALLDRLTHHVHILEMNGDSYRLGQSRARKAEPNP